MSAVLCTSAMRPALLLTVTLLVSACATPDQRFPSLALRDAERLTGAFQPPPPPPKPSIVPAETAGRIQKLRQQALAGHRRFQDQRGRAAALTNAAAGAPVASENWSVAQVALAELDTSRAGGLVAMADLDRALVAAWNAAAPTGGSAELDAVVAVREEVGRWIAEEDAAIAGLRARLRD